MKIRISDISADGLPVHGALPLANLNGRMNEGRGNDIIFLKDPEVDLVVHKSASGAYTKGKITTRYKQPCALCADELERDLEVEGNYIFQRRTVSEDSRHQEGDPETYFDDIGVHYFSGDHIELEEVIQETLILSLAQYLRPPLSPEGKCAICGKKPSLSNSSEDGPRPSFGQLLKNAGVR